VKTVSYISKQQALKELESRRKDTGEAIQLLGTNPLPATYRVVPKDPGQVQGIVDSLVTVDPTTGKKTFAMAGIGDVRNREQDTNKILSATSLVKTMTASLAALLVLASIALIANTIRLSIFARRREVEVMKLVGATNWFIRWPFVIEGMIVGFMGGVLAVLLLWIIKDTLVDPLSARFALIAAPNTIQFPALIAVLLASCVAVSAIGSGLTLRRFLRV
jgi:cell division transport system permease protein